MNRITIPIDTKSLCFNIKNDNESGHTATVATPMRQGSSVRPELDWISQIPAGVSTNSYEAIANILCEKSRAKVYISHICVFDKILVNGIKIDCNHQFCMYLREEIDPKNIHCGRIKLHYPQKFNYVDEYADINNKEVLKSISDTLKDYAFIVKSFEYDIESKMLNFIVVIVGENNIPYSKVFINERGAGNKFTSVFNEVADCYDYEIICLKKHFGECVSPRDYLQYITENQNKAIELVSNRLQMCGDFDIINISAEYPYCLYDISYKENGLVKYAIICSSSTKSKYFNLSLKKISFFNDFNEYTSLFLVTDINGNADITTYSFNDINELQKNINSIMYIDGVENYE